MKERRIRTLEKLPARPRDAHKGDFGRVLLIGGSRGMPGAIALAARAALRGGAGLVTFAVPQAVQMAVATLCPCATSIPLSSGSGGELFAAAVTQAAEAARKCDVLAVGPGLGVGSVATKLVHAALTQPKPLVLDADGLNNLASLPRWPELRRCPLVLTPHPGEFARLTGKKVPEVQAGREDLAAHWAAQWAAAGPTETPLVVVLKGAGTVVTDGRQLFVNRTGNPGMATGGSGDVLTGLLAALLAQRLEPFPAACLAAHLHGRAGDLAARKLGEISLTASDLVDYLPQAFRGI